MNTLVIQSYVTKETQEVNESDFNAWPETIKRRFKVVEKIVGKKENPFTKKAEPEELKSKNFKADDAINHIKEANLFGDELEAFVEGETRVTVIEFVSKRQNVEDPEETEN